MIHFPDKSCALEYLCSHPFTALVPEYYIVSDRCRCGQISIHGRHEGSKRMPARGRSHDRFGALNFPSFARFSMPTWAQILNYTRDDDPTSQAARNYLHVE